MKAVSRRGILAGLLVAGGVTHTAAAEPVLPKPTFLKGQIMPRQHLISDPHHTHSFGYSQPVVVFEYDIFDGKKFVPLNSDAGQRVVRELGG